MRKHQRFRSGVSPWSGSLIAIRSYAWHMWARSDTTVSSAWTRTLFPPGSARALAVARQAERRAPRPASCPKARSISPPEAGRTRTWVRASSGTRRGTAVTTLCRWTRAGVYAGPGIQGKLHMVEESRHEFGADWRAGEQSGTNDSGPQRPPERLGAFGVERHKPGQHLLDLLTAFRTRQALVGRSEPNPGRTHRRMATRRNRDVVERFPLH